MIGDAVAYRACAADELGEVADHLAGARAAASLCELLVASKRVDDVAGKMGTIGRRQRGALLALEVVLQQPVRGRPWTGSVDAGSLEISVEQQFRVGNDDGADRRPMR